MPYSIVIALKAGSIEAVSALLEHSTGVTGDPHESLYLGEYDIFLLPEKVIVKYNYVWSEDEWEFPEYKDYEVLLVAYKTERPEYIIALAAQAPSTDWSIQT